MKNWIASIIISVIIVLVVRQYLITIHVVSGSSMEPYLFQGDLVLVNPISNLTKAKIQKFDVVVFKEQLNSDEKQVKRVLGMPGDTLRCHSFVLENDIATAKKPYWVKTHNKESNWLNYGVPTAVPISLSNDWLIGLTDFERTHLLNQKNIKWAISPPENTLEKPTFLKLIPNWDLKKFGPLVVPKKGKAIVLTKNNWTLYESIMLQEADFDLKKMVEIIKNVGKFHFTPKQDYYFLIGDHRGISIDSRFYGFIPKKALKGVLVSKLFSGLSVKMPESKTEH